MQKVDGTIFLVRAFPLECAVVVEYADNRKEAEMSRFEDGDRFYLDAMTEDEMFEAIVEEIEG